MIDLGSSFDEERAAASLHPDLASNRQQGMDGWLYLMISVQVVNVVVFVENKSISCFDYPLVFDDAEGGFESSCDSFSMQANLHT